MRLRHMTYLLASTLALGASSASAASVATSQQLEDLVAIALEQNPQLDALAAQVAALEHKATWIGAWKDPKVMLAYQNLPVDAIDQPQAMSMLTARIEQTFPWFGKTEQRAGVVHEAVAAKRWSLEERRVQLRGLVKKVYYQLALARQLKKLTHDHVGLIEQLIDAVRIKYEVGRAAQHHLVRLEVLRDRLVDNLNDFDRRDAELTGALNSALHRPVDVPVFTPEGFEVPAPLTDMAGFKGRALESRPALKEFKATARMHDAAAELAQSEAVPDPTLFGSYGFRPTLPAGMPGQHLVTFGVAVPLPVFFDSSYGAKANEASSKARATDANREALIDTIQSRLADALATWTRSIGKVATYRDTLVPGAHRALDATFSSYQVDRADFLSLFEAELELLNFEKTIRVATVDALVAQAAIEMLTGKEL